MTSERTTALANQILSKVSLVKKGSLLLTAGASALMVASAAYAQTPEVESVTVSSSRIVNSGMQAPTPTTVMAADFIQQQNKDHIFTAVTQLPSLMGSTGVQSNVNATSGGTNGLASFNVFGLGTIRTLTLLDGQRFVPGNVAGINDINQFPQMLIQRVDVVTGGASASWGSDAISAWSMSSLIKDISVLKRIYRPAFRIIEIMLRLPSALLPVLVLRAVAGTSRCRWIIVTATEWKVTGKSWPAAAVIA